MTKRTHPLGIYEKALPKAYSWAEKLAAAGKCGYDFVEMSIDETDERLARLEWSKSERRELAGIILDSGLRIPSICLSAHRRFPFGSRDAAIRARAELLMNQAIELAQDIGVRTLQLAGYDVYYEPHDAETEERFAIGLAKAVERAAGAQVMLAVEIMDTDYINSITAWKKWDDRLRSPWFTVYPDIGNLTAWDNDVAAELALGIDRIAAIHLKETRKVRPDFPGQFRDLLFGEGEVDFIGAFKTLKALDYRGAFMVEMWTEKAADPLREITVAREWLERRAVEAGWRI